MAGERAANNEGRGAAATTLTTLEGEQPHSRVGGIKESDPAVVAAAAGAPGDNKQPPSNEQQSQQRAQVSTAVIRGSNVVHGICRYAAEATSGGMSFVEICQIRLQQLFPQLSSPQRSTICEDSLELTAEYLANDVIRYLLKEDIYMISRDPVSRSMRHNVYQMLNKHTILFTSMVNRLNVVPDTAYEAFMGVADELFYQGVTWARIVCLYAFMGRLALWARDRRMHGLKQKLPMYVSRYISEEIAQFIKISGGWEQLCIEYPVAEEVGGAVWRSLLMTGATLGLVATILSVTS
ncbi:bcl-2-like protein 2 [Copidosoma floridanum]|uniref:bcl-2-like protein 2 n=1 Tax=Copidosoma floridanum TaxID=29053 RepID=UPI0006C9614D|nr:bcl-2-like protein 2 [Copidosoma floridanum]